MENSPLGLRWAFGSLNAVTAKLSSKIMRFHLAKRSLDSFKIVQARSPSGAYHNFTL